MIKQYIQPEEAVCS